MMTVPFFISMSFSVAFALLAFGAMYRPAELGYLGASPGVLLISLPLALHFMLIILGKAAWTRHSLDSAWLLAYGVLLSIAAALYFEPTIFFGVKALNLFVLSILWLSPFILAGYLKRNHLKFGAALGSLICFSGIVIELNFEPLYDALKPIIFSSDYQTNENGRLRGFSSEASQAAANLLRYLLILFIISDRFRGSVTAFNIFFIILVAVALLIQSKGAVISLFISYLVSFMHRKAIVSLVAVGFIFALVLFPYAIQILIYDFENYSSISTRFILFLTVILSVLTIPLGYGFYGFYPAMNAFGTRVISFFEGGIVDTAEAASILIEFEALSSKSSVLDFMYVFGMPFLIVLARSLRRMDVSQAEIRFALCFIVLTSLFSSGHETIFLFAGLLAMEEKAPHNNRVSSFVK